MPKPTLPLPEHSKKIKIQQEEKLRVDLTNQKNEKTKKPSLERSEQPEEKIDRKILKLLDNNSIVLLGVVYKELETHGYDTSSFWDRIYALRDDGLLEIVLKHEKGKKPIFLRKLAPKEKA